MSDRFFPSRGAAKARAARAASTQHPWPDAQVWGTSAVELRGVLKTADERTARRIDEAERRNPTHRGGRKRVTDATTERLGSLQASAHTTQEG